MPQFRLIAVEDTEHWSKGLIPEGVRTFGIYLIQVGEATHCGSITPAQWCLFVEHRYVDRSELSDKQYEERQEQMRGIFSDALVGIEPGMYILYSDSYKIQSEEFSFEDWEEAEEWFRGNYAACRGNGFTV